MLRLFNSSGRLRKETRYSADLEIHVEATGRSMVTRTRDVSTGGIFFFTGSPPAVGEALQLQLHPESGEAIALRAVVRYRIPDVGAGAEVEEGEDLLRFREMVDELARTANAWHAINGFVSGEEARTPIPAVFEDRELIPIGECCEAIRVMFERYPPLQLPERHALSARLKAISADPISLKLHEKDRLREVLIGVMREDGAYAALLVPSEQTANPTMYALRGKESIVVTMAGKTVYPHFSKADLHRIGRDTVPPARHPIPPSPRAITADLPAFPQRELIEALSRWTRYDRRAEYALNLLFERAKPETRVYQVRGTPRPVRLLRDLTVRVRNDGREDRGIPFDDGVRLCVIVEAKNRPLAVRPLTDTDEICILALPPRPPS